MERNILLVGLISTISLAAFAAITPSATECTTNCSPSWCANVSNEPCEFGTQDPGVAESISEMTCNDQCTQSTDAKCTTESLTAFVHDEGSVKAAYCTDKFLVFWTEGFPHHNNWLGDIPRPPGGDGPYETACVVRTMAAQSQTYKIPLTFNKLADGASNADEIIGKLASVDLPAAGAIGVSSNGVPIYPSHDNADKTVWSVCEADLCNSHAGKGEDYHYHGDPFGPSCLYTADERDSSGTHPPHVGWAMDGAAIYGRHSADGLAGMDVDLDSCGGHEHGDYGYHYHASEETVSGDNGYTGYYFAPKDCWAGDISSIENFWDTNQVNYDNSKTSPKYDPSKRNDYDNLRPCCSSTQGFVDSGVTVPGLDPTTGTTTETPTTTTPDSTTDSSTTTDTTDTTTGTTDTSTTTDTTTTGTTTTTPTTTTSTAGASSLALGVGTMLAAFGLVILL